MLRRTLNTLYSKSSRKLKNLLNPLLYNIYGKSRTPPLFEYISVRDSQQINNCISKILEDTGRISIMFLPKQTWFSYRFQRSHQMARALSELGCNVIYHEPWHEDVDTTDDGRKNRQFRGFSQIEPHLWLLRYPDIDLKALLLKYQPDALIMEWPFQARYIPEDSLSFVVYEMVDDHKLVPNANEAWFEVHRKWVQASDIMITTSDDLLAQIQPLRADAMLLQNGVRLEDWRSATPNTVPSDMLIARRYSVVVGYYGVFSDWFDWELWIKAAQSKPDWAFVLIGMSISNDQFLKQVGKAPNIFYLGPKPYSELPQYLASFDIATIPFILNEITHACSPVKLFEYFAAGKPVVASPMREITKYSSVLFAHNLEEFIQQIENAQNIKNNAQFLINIERDAKENTWLRRAESLKNAIISCRIDQNYIPRRHLNN